MPPGNKQFSWANGPLTRYTKLRIAHAPVMPGAFSPPPRVSDPGRHHGTCVTHVPWCMPGSLTSGFLWSRRRKNVPGIPRACATRNFTNLARGPCWHSSVSPNRVTRTQCVKGSLHFTMLPVMPFKTNRIALPASADGSASTKLRQYSV